MSRPPRPAGSAPPAASTTPPALRPLAGFPTHVLRLTPGRRPALLIHCSLGRAAAYAPLARALAERGGDHALTGFDLPGHGQSGAWPIDAQGIAAPGYHDRATAIAAELAAELAAGLAAGLAAEGAPPALIGHSFGATVALRLALERPDLAGPLVLIDPVLFAAADPAARAARQAAEAPTMQALARGDRPAAARAFLAQWGAPGGWEALPEAQRARLAARLPLIPAAAPELWQDAAGLLAPGRLESLHQPVLLIAGADSPAIMPAICVALAARLPAARRHSLPGAGHMLPMTHPAETAALLAGFLADAA